MAGLFGVDPVDDDQSSFDAQYSVDRSKSLPVTAETAQRVGQIYRQAPFIPANVVLSLAKAGASQEAVNTVASLAARQLPQKNDPNKPEKKSWFQRNIADKAKSVARWTFAGLNFVPEVTQNVAAQVFSPNDPAGFDGWFASTSLGTLAGNSTRAGDGWFIGEEAAELQAERARRVRGTINGHAWTVGRGAASQIFTPGSLQYNLLSGFVDASVTLAADPTLYGGKALKTVRASRNAVAKIDDPEVLAAARKIARGEAGLTEAEWKLFEQSKFGQWVNSNKKAQRLVRRVAEVGADETLDVDSKTLRILEMFDYNIDPAVAKVFAEADSEQAVRAVLGEASARLSGGRDVLLPTDVREIRGARRFTEWSDRTAERVPFYRGLRNHRWWQQIPKGTVVVNGNGLDRAEAIKSYANYMRGLGFDDDSEIFKTLMPRVVAAFSEVDPAAARPLVNEVYELVFEETLVAAGGTRDAARKVVNLARQRQAEARAFNISALGTPDDGGTLRSLAQLATPDWLANSGISPDQWDNIQLMGPGLLSELADDVQVLPDFRQMRRLMSNSMVARALKTGVGDGIDAVVTTLQNEIWKPITLATGGYIMRNMMDAQVRIGMSGLSGFFTHPIDYIQWVLGKKGFGDILARDFDNEVAKLSGRWPEEMKEFADALTFDMYRNLEDTQLAKERLLTTGNFYLMNRATDAAAHTTGYVDNLGLLSADPLVTIWARLAALPEAERKVAVLAWLNSPDGASAKRTLENYFRNGLKYTDPATGKIEVMPIDASRLDEALDTWVERLVNIRVSTITSGDADLNMVVAAKRVPRMVTNEEGVTTVVGREVLDADQFDTPPQLGDVVDIDGGQGVVTRVLTEATDDVDPFTGQRLGERQMFEVQPVYSTPAFEGGLGSPELRQLIDMKAGMVDEQGNMTVLAPTVKIAGRGVGEEATGALERAAKAKDAATDAFFNRFYGGLTRTFEKSPVFRQYYYRNVLDNIDLVAPAEARRLLSMIETRAEDLGMSVEKFVGGKDVLDAIRKQVDNAASKADGTVEQLDEYAKMVALNQTKKLLYNATERNNIEDILRVIVPFGSAWKEVMGTYLNALVEDPTRIRKAQLIFQGGMNMDFNGDGQGFFYRDPTTGEYSFNFPLSGELSQLLTGVEAPLQAPVKRLSIGLQVIPALGPVGQIAASQIIPDTPTFDGITSVLLPFGRDRGISFAPMWLTRLQQAISANPGATETIYANTYIETVRALAASGEYNLADLNEQNKLYEDARGKARILAGMRAIGQFLGPTSPSAEFVIPTDEGDVYGSMLVKEFQRLQNENYSTAVNRFIEIYGDNAMIYLSNKTESLVQGLEATDEFGEWERANGRLLATYKNTAAFMAPSGDDFSFEVWSRQIRAGKRRRLTAREMVEAAQNRIGSALYREMRDKLPANPTDEQRAWLRNWRVEINRRYPGFPVVAEFNPGEYPNTLLELEQLVQDPDLVDNEVAQATAEYLQARRDALARANEAGFTTLKSQAATPLRDWLADYGRYLSATTPEFARIWDRLLSFEVEE